MPEDTGDTEDTMVQHSSAAGEAEGIGFGRPLHQED